MNLDQQWYNNICINYILIITLIVLILYKINYLAFVCNYGKMIPERLSYNVSNLYVLHIGQYYLVSTF